MNAFVEGCDSSHPFALPEDALPIMSPTDTIANPPAGFDDDLAVELARLVVAAYDQFKPPAGAPSKWPLSPPQQLITSLSARLPIHETETFGFVSRRADTGDVYVAFRGTESADDWLVNIAVRQVTQPHSWGMVEDGFADVYGQCSGAILAALRELAPPRVIVTGHSLGGALATLCAADIHAALGLTPVLYSFASPRVGDPAFAARFNAECPGTWRVVNTEDLITTVPLATTVLEATRRSLLDDVLHLIDHIPVISNWVKRRFGWARLWRSHLIYEHIGAPVCFTKNNGTVVANHQISTYLAAVEPANTEPVRRSG